MSVLAEFDQIQKIKVAKEKENMQRIEITVKSNNQEAVSMTSEKIKIMNHASKRSWLGGGGLENTPVWYLSHIKSKIVRFFLKEGEKIKLNKIMHVYL